MANKDNKLSGKKFAIVAILSLIINASVLAGYSIATMSYTASSAQWYLHGGELNSTICQEVNYNNCPPPGQGVWNFISFIVILYGFAVIIAGYLCFLKVKKTAPKVTKAVYGMIVGACGLLSVIGLIIVYLYLKDKGMME